MPDRFKGSRLRFDDEEVENVFAESRNLKTREASFSALLNKTRKDEKKKKKQVLSCKKCLFILFQKFLFAILKYFFISPSCLLPLMASSASPASALTFKHHNFHNKQQHGWVAAIAQWFCLCLPSCSPGFES